MGFRTAQNYHVPVRNWTTSDVARFLTRGRRPRYTKHMSAKSIKARIDEATWGNYFKFCVERNPYDRAVSLYYWRTRNEAVRMSLVEFLRSLDASSLSNFHIYSLSGKVAVDQVIRYEQLAQCMEQVSARLGLGDLELPRAKTESRTDRAHYRELMSEEARAIVERACAREIELLEYEF
jgi:hypothetical protein